ncbi:MAG: hypothetical protein NTW86_01130 [Candidatus Sumerlaeota bacterium]|nr:hypothetical protein [Candidatus Sumerlaeota bacterium]
MKALRAFVSFCLFAAGFMPSSADARLYGKAHRLLLERGLQSQAMVSRDDPFSLATYQAAGFTAVDWIWNSRNEWLGAPPGFGWARWVGNPSQMPFLPGEEPYASSLVGLQLGDEQDFNQPSVRAAAATWYASARDRFPAVLLFSNNYGGQVTNPNLDDFIRASQPDLLSFDTYPFTPSGPAYGSPTNLYGDMQRYRKFALTYRVPYRMYTQTFHDYMTRDPSEPEMRLNYFAGLTFGYTYFAAFTYNTGATSLFQGPGDQNPTPAYAHITEINRRLRILGPTLTRLVNTDVRFINGQHLPAGGGLAENNSTPIDVLNWQFNVNDPWLRGWVVTNLGGANNGLDGDVILGWFHVLDETLDGPGFQNETYMMVLNGLSDPNGSAADCRQEIKLDFAFGASGISQVQRLNQEKGQVELLDLPFIPSTQRRQLVLQIDGGTAELFKFNTGAPFVLNQDPQPTGVDSGRRRQWEP